MKSLDTSSSHARGNVVTGTGDNTYRHGNQETKERPLTRSRDRRHGPQEDRGDSSPSPLGAEWPPLTALYSRTSEDLAEPPLVNGRLPVRDPECTLCTLAEDLIEGRDYGPDQAAWAERELVLAIHRDRGTHIILGELSSSHGVEVSEEALQKHIAEHLPSADLWALESMRGWSSEEFNAASWRAVFDLHYLIVEKTRQGLASGALSPTLAEGISAAKGLSDLLSYTLEAKQNSTSNDSLAEMQMFVGMLSQAVEDTVSDPVLREELFGRMRQLLAEHTEPPEADPESQFPRGREHNSGEPGTEQAGESSRGVAPAGIHRGGRPGGGSLPAEAETGRIRRGDLATRPGFRHLTSDAPCHGLGPVLLSAKRQEGYHAGTRLQCAALRGARQEAPRSPLPGVVVQEPAYPLRAVRLRLQKPDSEGRVDEPAEGLCLRRAPGILAPPQKALRIPRSYRPGQTVRLRVWQTDTGSPGHRHRRGRGPLPVRRYESQVPEHRPPAASRPIRADPQNSAGGSR